MAVGLTEGVATGAVEADGVELLAATVCVEVVSIAVAGGSS